MPHVVASSSLPSAVTTRGRTPASSSRVVLPGHRGTTARARAVAGPRIIVDGGAESAMRGLSEKRREVIEDMGSFAGGELMGLLKDPDTNWQPQDWLPDPSRDDFLDQVRGDDATRRDATEREGNEIRRGCLSFSSGRARTRERRGSGLVCEWTGRASPKEWGVYGGNARMMTRWKRGEADERTIERNE